MSKNNMKDKLTAVFQGARPGGVGQEDASPAEGSVITGVAAKAQPEAPKEAFKKKAQPAAGVKGKKAPSKLSAPKKATKREAVVAKAAEQPAKAEKEFKVPFNLQMPQSLHQRLSHYADNFAVGRSSSVTRIILEAVEKHLTDLERKAGIKN